MTATPGLSAVTRIRDPRVRAQRAAALLDTVEAEILAVRDTACREMLEAGASFAEVGRTIGRTRSLAAKRFPEFAKDKP